MATVPSIPPVWLYWVLHIGAIVFGLIVPLVLFFVAKGMDVPPKDDFATGGMGMNGPQGGMMNQGQPGGMMNQGQQGGMRPQGNMMNGQQR